MAIRDSLADGDALLDDLVAKLAAVDADTWSSIEDEDLHDRCSIVIQSWKELEPPEVYERPFPSRFVWEPGDLA